MTFSYLLSFNLHLLTFKCLILIFLCNVCRAMETVIKEHNLDIESLMSSRLPLAAGAQIGDSTSQQLAGIVLILFTIKMIYTKLPMVYCGLYIYDCYYNVTSVSSQLVGASTESKSGNETCTPEAYASTRGPTGGQDTYQGSAAHITGIGQ